MTRFYLLSGAGNDFIALAEPDTDPSPENVQQWCRRGSGVGADGVLVIRRLTDGVDLVYRNADGNEADLCINGARCAARLADHIGWSQGATRLRTRVGWLHAAAKAPGRYEIEAPLPAQHPQQLTLESAGVPYKGWRVTVGVPHFVVLDDQLPQSDFARIAEGLRHHQDLAPTGANVHFAAGGDGRFEMRSFERGVEAETLACGTGALGVAAATLAAGTGSLPLRLLTRGGFELEIEGTSASDGSIESWRLTGDARLLADGTLLDEATL